MRWWAWVFVGVVVLVACGGKESIIGIQDTSISDEVTDEVTDEETGDTEFSGVACSE